MDSDAMLRETMDRYGDLQGRAFVATEDLTEEQLNQRVPGFHWTIAQICEHLLLAHGAYIAIIEEAMERPPRTGPDAEVHYSWVGRLIAHFAGPNGHSPVPPAAQPSAQAQFPEDVVQDMLDQISALSRLAERAKGIPIASVRVRNPYVPILKMNLADCFHIPAEHLERHVRQLESCAAVVRAKRM